MFYCENCYLLNEENTCAFCGSRLTRGPKMDDYCFIGSKCSPWAEMYHGILKDDHIPVIIRQWSPRTAAYTGEVGTRTDFFVPLPPSLTTPGSLNRRSWTAASSSRTDRQTG